MTSRCRCGGQLHERYGDTWCEDCDRDILGPPAYVVQLTAWERRELERRHRQEQPQAASREERAS